MLKINNKRNPKKTCQIRQQFNVITLSRLFLLLVAAIPNR